MKNTWFQWYWLLEWQALIVVAMVVDLLVWWLHIDEDIGLMLSILIWVVCGIVSIGAGVLVHLRLGSNRVESPWWFKLPWLPVLFIALLITYIAV